uniref:Uncharacterized protein n=1 Tax=Picea glauca TaxID=3330 RepID=A0A124GMQ6_PICGL|nr:hypothetical protein ABT39_MTgene1547 [Picea glauca]
MPKHVLRSCSGCSSFLNQGSSDDDLIPQQQLSCPTDSLKVGGFPTQVGRSLKAAITGTECWLKWCDSGSTEPYSSWSVMVGPRYGDRG